MNKVLLPIGAAIALLCISSPAWAATLTVPGQYTTIQAAISASANGDRIEVAAGTYNEQINFNGKDIVVVGTAGAAQTIIDGGSQGQVVRLTSSEPSTASLEGFTIQNGQAVIGGGVNVISSAGLMLNSDATIRNVIIRNMAVGQSSGVDNYGGSAVSVFGGSPVIENSLMYGTAHRLGPESTAVTALSMFRLGP